MKHNVKWIRSVLALLLLAALVLGMWGCGAGSDSLNTSAPSTLATEENWPPLPGDETTGETSAAATVDGVSGATEQSSQQKDPTGEVTEDTQVTTESSQPDGSTDAQTPTQQPKPTEPIKPVITGSGLKVHFIDVGQADAALVTCDNKTMLIDGGNAGDSNLMYTYLKKNGITHLDYVIGTHAHEDHIGGIAGALNYATVGKVYCPSTSYSSKAFNNFVKAVNNRGTSIVVPSSGLSFSLGGATVKILAVNAASGTNNTSIVLRITYGSTSFLFMGDAEYEVEQMLVNSGINLQSTVLKVGHHGSSTSSSYGFLWHVMPKYAVISVGKGNSYGHPTETVLSRLRDADTKLYRTDMQGDIIATSNGSSVSFSVSRNAYADTFGGIGSNSTQNTEPTQPAETTPETTQPTQNTQPPVDEGVGYDYLANKNSWKFHYPHCEWAQKMSAGNRLEFTGTREELLEQGYKPCGSCNP